MMSSTQLKRVKRVKRATMPIFNDEAYQHPAICIPRGLGKITHKELTSIVQKTGLGDIYKIIIKPREFILPEWERTTSAPTAAPTADTAATTTTTVDNAHKVVYNNIYIYFKKWNTDNPIVQKYRNNLLNGQSIKIVYNTIPTPIFWRCVAANFHRR